ncbi:sensor histidine kinase [Salisediminibacterium halotolerans]|uniref:Signal transduction histidine-protein kinase/phosphatase DegS n=1 Tax=Salisediminibacterium halotolerans TaxID=517425 RepID=A0A1H9TUB8_9BACI|nr:MULTISPECIES: sensor histidine kinase [Salisediminibacterium]RLJ75552.1 two-component system sensor histidine kinase DegS [Actinophytocola xinjiangensis]RPE89405.1 two-component system sensor histidine kinase DegS [Salisediminibacterium halotolerans]TWG36165.1 two-component system sensor histidine kinase DegS [Salisediminibacterium halotolerans]SES00363.1 two-component system, NarL family, sensor histidine kinase DegS [Salisediminibacterium haloalkalitolerans]GEL07641.1 signal transduction 
MNSASSIDQILDNMMDMVAKSKEEIFEIGEDSRSEYEQLNKELKDIQQKVVDVIERSERTELHSRFARNRLAEVSKHFGSYTDEEVKEAYEQAKDYQIQLAVLQQEETQLRERRDQIERRLLKLRDTIERADQLINQINAVLHYLSGDLQAVSDFVHDAEEMQKFGVRIIQAQEEERKKLSREIHDGPAQSMANVMLRSELVEKVLDQESVAKAREEIRDLRAMVQSTLSEVRRIIYDLRPMTLDDLGLAPTLAKYLRTVDDHHDAVTIRFKNVGDDRRLPSHIEIAIFRFIQEGVQNALKHAEPDQIEVKLDLKKDRATALVRDDGKGFLTEEASEDSFGLVGMKERVNMLEGELTIDSKPRKGTLIMMHIPIDASEPAAEHSDS